MTGLRTVRRRLASALASWAGRERDRFWHEAPLASRPLADPARYRELHAEARAHSYPEIDQLERELGFAVDREWFEVLASRTQVVVKASSLNYQHGRLLYSVLRRYLADRADSGPITIVETGTARGFSALCMARAVSDAGQVGRVITIDVLPHDTPILWNCIADEDGPMSRRSLLQAYRPLLEQVVFLEGDTRRRIHQVGLERVHLAFLDAQHTYQDVMAEAGAVMPRQRPGDIIVFDDVTEPSFPGVVRAVDELSSSHRYDARRLSSSDARGYAILTCR